MQQHALIGRAEREQPAHLGRIHVQNVAHGDHQALAFGQFVQFTSGHREQFGTQRRTLRCVRERSWGFLGFPVAGPWIVVGAEPLRVDRTAGVRRDLDVGVRTVAQSAGFGDVDQHGEKPGTQRRPAGKTVDPLQQRDPGLLHDLLGDLVAGHVSARDPQHRRGVLIDQRGERGLIARPQGGDEVGLGG